MEPTVLTFYSHDCVDWLKRALESATDQEKVNDPLSYHRRRIMEEEASSSSSEEERSDSESSSSDSNEEEGDTNQKKHLVGQVEEASANIAVSTSDKEYKQKTIKKTRKTTTIKKLGTPPMTFLRIQMNDDSLRVRIELASALLGKSDRQSGSNNAVLMAQSYLQLSQSLLQKPTIVLLLRSGRFAGGVFEKDQCIVHRSTARYTVRRGQGKAQSSQDSGKRKAQSMGAQLRRAGEEQLQQDVMNTLQGWQKHVENAALILWSCPKTMRKQLFSGSFLSKFDDRLRHVPLDFGRPSYESVCAVYETMMKGTVREDDVSIDTVVEETDRPAELAEDASAAAESCETIVEEKEIIPLSPLHEYARHGNLEALNEILSSSDTMEEQIDQPAGEDMMCPLHYAADSCIANNVDPSVAADVLWVLLINGQANPCMVDARNRVPYFLASNEKLRETFRRARAILGEDRWAWDEGAKVGPPLTEDDVERKKEKAAEKKRRQRARQKEKKAREKEQAEEMARRMKEEEETRKQEEDAKRIRAGLQPKATSATNVCDYCQKVCRGKRRSQMFQRLDYVYCSADCVQKHKRELMASAALSRVNPAN